MKEGTRESISATFLAPGRGRKNLAISAVVVATAVVLVFHFAMTALYVAPLNMGKLRLLPVMRAYMEPYFAQGWELFAPDPILDSKYLMVSCRLTRGSGPPEETPFIDVSSRLHALQHHRITPADRIARAELSAMILVAPPRDRLADRILELEGTDAALRQAAEEVKLERERGRRFGYRLLARTASAECNRMYPDREKTAVHPMFVSVAAPKFSERHRGADAGERSSVDFDWLPYEHVASL